MVEIDLFGLKLGSKKAKYGMASQYEKSANREYIIPKKEIEEILGLETIITIRVQGKDIAIKTIER